MSYSADKNALNDTDKIFCERYLVNGHNAAEAYRVAHPKCGMKASAAIGQKLVKKPAVAAYIEKRIASLLKKYDVSADWIIQETRKIAGAKITDVVDQNFKLKNQGQISEEGIAAIQEVEYENSKGENKVKRVRMYNKIDALDKLAKMVGVYKEEPLGDDKATPFIIMVPHNSRFDIQVQGKK